MKRGLFITFEGGEGAGKTTQIKKLGAALGDDCIVTREPGGTPAAEAMRNIFTSHKGQDWPVVSLLLLMFAARAHHTITLIKPNLENGKTVICDRYTDSTRVYQGYASDFSSEKIEIINQIAIESFEPDLTFILDIPASVGLKRSELRTADDTFESKTIVFHETIRKGFLDIAAKNPKRCIVIDALQNEDAIAAEIYERVKNHV